MPVDQTSSAASTVDLPRSIEIAIVGLALVGVALLAAHPLSSPDTFWHLKLGEIIARQHAVPRTDLFSAVHPDRPWVQFAWLWELLAHAVDAAFGLRGLRVLQAALMVKTFAVLYVLARRAAGHAAPAMFLGASALLLFVDRFQARPDALSLLLATLAAPLVLGGFRRLSPRGALGLFALALGWTCLHAGTSLLLIGISLAVASGAWLNSVLRLGPCAGGEPRDEPLRALLLAALPLATFVLVPGALGSVVHFSSVFGSIVAAREPEWRPSLVMLGNGHHPVTLLTAFAPYVVGAAYALAQVRAVRRIGRSAVDLAELVPCLACLLLAALVTRNLFLCLLPLAAMTVRSRPRLGQRRALYLGALLLFASAADWAGRDAYGGFARARVAFAHDLAPGAYPEHAAAFMRRAGIAGKIFNLPRWGDYLVYTQYPRCRVFFDSRRNVTQAMWDLLERAAHPDLRADMLDAAFARYGTELVVYEAPVFAGYRPTGPWRLLYKAGPEEVYQHAAGRHAAQNLAAAQRELGARGLRVPDDDTSPAYLSAVSGQGAREWRSSAWEHELEHEQREALGSADPAAVHGAKRALGLLAFRAGDYADAAQHLSGVLRRDPTDASARYHLAFALLLSGERERATQVAHAFTQQSARSLSPAQRYRLGVLLRELSSPK